LAKNAVQGVVSEASKTLRNIRSVLHQRNSLPAVENKKVIRLPASMPSDLLKDGTISDVAGGLSALGSVTQILRIGVCITISIARRMADHLSGTVVRWTASPAYFFGLSSEQDDVADRLRTDGAGW